MAKRFLSALLCVLLVASSVVFAYATETETEETPTKTNAYELAAIELDKQYGYDGDDLGATYTPERTTFKAWAPTATEITLNLYTTGSDSEEGAANLGQYPMEKELNDAGEFTGIWKITVEGNLLNIFYTYTVTAYNTTGEKVTTVETQDIYSVATGVNSKRSMIVDLDKTDPEGWENDQHVLLDKSTDSVVWEVHVKDFTYSLTSGVSDQNRGKYLGFTETGTTLNSEGNISTCIDYLKELGVTTVQILPFYDYGSVNEEGADDQFNWGYDPMNYNVPEGSYSSNPYDGNVRITECKQMIQALHNAGISVVMDVVYNHTYSYNSAFEAMVPNYYYRMKADGAYSNGSGCGNETASEHRMYRNFIIQSCKYWVEEFHVDGFRFDLMGILDTKTMNMVRETLDEIDPRLTIWGEGWTGGTCTYAEADWEGDPVYGASQANASKLDEDIAMFNDEFRDGVKGKSLNFDDFGWVQGAKAYASNVRYGIVANTKGGKWSAQSPAQCVTYLSCHDNTTLWDKLCDTNGKIDDYETRNSNIISQNKLSAGLLAMSQGICFIHAGEEMGRTKLGDHNSYSSSADINKINWEWTVANADLVSYYRGLLEIRKNFATLTDNTAESSGLILQKQSSAFNTITYVIKNNVEGQWQKMAVLANNTTEPIEFKLSDPNNEWVIIADDESAGLDNLGEVLDNNFVIPAKGMLIAVDKASYESVGLTSNTGKVTVKHVDSVTNKVIDEFVVAGEIGTYYQTMQTNAGLKYKLNYTEGDVVGVFTEEPQTVVYYYDYLVPDSVKIDLDGNGKLNIKDVTVLQRGLVKMTELTDEQLAVSDCNYDGTFDINDITMLQKHLAGESVSVGEVVVNYYKTGTDETICSSTVYTDIIGTEFTAEPTSALGYVLNTEMYPETETVKVAYGVTNEINYYYDFIGNEVKIHVKHSTSELTWDPVIWIWGQKNGSDSGTNYCINSVWPGDVLTKEEGDTWYTTGFTAESTDNTYCMLITDGDSGQSPDCKDFTQLELWCVIDDVNSKSSVALLFYDVNPDENPDAQPIYKS